MNKKLIAVALCIMLLTSAICVNASVMVDDAASAVTVSGTLASQSSGVNIGIDVFYPDKSYADLSSRPSEYEKLFLYKDQVKSGDGGNWEVTFRIGDDPEKDYDAQSGEYTVVIFPADSEEAYTETFTYVNLKEAEAVLQQLKTADSARTASLLDEYRRSLGLNYEFYSRLDIRTVAELLHGEIAGGALEGAAVAEGIRVVRKAVILCAVTDGLIPDLFAYRDVLDIEHCAVGPFADKSYVAANYQSITEFLKGKEFGSYSDFDSKLTEATVLSVVRKSNGEGNLQEIADAFAAQIGYTAPLRAGAYRSVMGKSYSSLEQLAKALLSYSDGGSGNGPGGGSSGGSGNSGNSGGSSKRGSTTGSTAGSVPPVSPEAETIPFQIFTDIDGVEWAKDAIVYLAQKGIVNGKTNDTFCPDDLVTREEAAKILVLAFAPDSVAQEISFADVSRESWYYPYVSRAVGAGIVKGYDETRFGSGDSVTREDLVTMIYRAAQSAGMTFEEGQVSFTDGDKIAPYALEAVGALTKLEIISGIDFSTFAPKEPATRAQMAKIIYRLIEN